MPINNVDRLAVSDERSETVVAVAKPKLVKLLKIVDDLQLATSSLLSAHQHHRSRCPLKISEI